MGFWLDGDCVDAGEPIEPTAPCQTRLGWPLPTRPQGFPKVHPIPPDRITNLRGILVRLSIDYVYP